MSFRLKTVLSIASIEIAMLILLVWSGVGYVSRSGESGLINAAGVSARLIATMTTDAILASDLARLQSLVESGLENQSLVYIRIRSANGKILAQKGATEALSEPFKEDKSIADTLDRNRFDVSAPVAVSGKVYGSVELGMSTTLLKNMTRDARDFLISVAALEIVLVAIFGFVLGSVLTRQLSRLRAGAREVSQGSLGHQIVVSGNDELADASRSFNSMSQALSHLALELQNARDAALRARDYAEDTLHDAMDSMPNAVVVVDQYDNVEFANYEFRKKLGVEVANLNVTAQDGNLKFSDLCRRTLPIIEDPDKFELSFDERLARRIKYFQSSSNESGLEERTTDGRTLLTYHRFTSRGSLVVVETDVTELRVADQRNRRLELELMQRQKMESLGTMAGGIAHEINTPLQYVSTNISFLKNSYSDIARKIPEWLGGRHSLLPENIDWEFLSSEIPAAIREVEQGLGAVSAIVQSIKHYAHAESEGYQAVDISEVINSAATLSRNEWKYVAELTFEMAEGIPAVPCLRAELTQVLINLIVNAAQAIQGRASQLEKGRIELFTRNCGPWIEIHIADNGPGVPPSIRDRIFDLFFTTKAPGQGTGQGLAISKVIVEQKHHGHLEVLESGLGGAEFVIRLPISQILEGAAE